MDFNEFILHSKQPPPPPALPISSSSNDKPKQLPVVDDGRSALMDSIRKGAVLKKVEASSTHSSGGDSRNDLLSEIRGGVDLRPVGDRPQGNRLSGEEHGGTADALADALRKALEKRRNAFEASSSESEAGDDDDNEWSD